MEKIKAAGAGVTYPVEVADLSSLAVDGEDAIMPIACKSFSILVGHTDTTVWDFKNICIPRFIRGFDHAPVKTLQDIIDFNSAYAARCLPSRNVAPLLLQSALIFFSIYGAKRFGEGA